MATQIITVSDALTYLELGEDAGGVIALLVPEVNAAIERHVRRTLASTARTEYHDGDKDQIITLDRPIASLTSIRDLEDTATDPLGEPVDLDGVDYDPEAGLIFLKDGCRWGSGRRRWKVAYTGGLAASDDAKQAALITLADRYQWRNGNKDESLGDMKRTRDGTGLPQAARDLLSLLVADEGF